MLIRYFDFREVVNCEIRKSDHGPRGQDRPPYYDGFIVTWYLYHLDRASSSSEVVYMGPIQVAGPGFGAPNHESIRLRVPGIVMETLMYARRYSIEELLGKKKASLERCWRGWNYLGYRADT